MMQAASYGCDGACMMMRIGCVCERCAVHLAWVDAVEAAFAAEMESDGNVKNVNWRGASVRTTRCELCGAIGSWRCVGGGESW